MMAGPIIVDINQGSLRRWVYFDHFGSLQTISLPSLTPILNMEID